MNIIQRLFGETEEAQFYYLKPRLMGFAVGFAAVLIGGLLYAAMGLKFGGIISELGTIVCVVDLLVFGWAILRGLFGVATISALFSGNIVFGVVVFVIYLMVGYIGGMIVAVIGLCRFLVLLKRKKGN